MTLLAPAAMWLALLSLPVVALYLLKIKRRRQPVPALEFWLELAGQRQTRSLFQRLKRWLSLALWLLILACLVLAVGNPLFSLGRIKPQSIAIILDNSASMQTLESPQNEKPRTRLADAIDAITEMTSGRPVSDEWLLIDAARRPRVLAPWTLDRRTITDAAASIVPHTGSSDLRAARDLAAQLLAGKPRPCVVIISDGAAGQVPDLIHNDPIALFWPIGHTDDNLGIARLRVRPNREQSAQIAYVSVVNASKQHIDTQLVFEIDGSTTAVEPLAIDPGATWEKTVALQAPQGGVLRVSIDRRDALPSDNEAFAVLEPMAQASVLLVTPAKESFFFQQALSAMDSLVDNDASHTLTIDDYDARNKTAAAHDLTIFNDCTPRAIPSRGQFVFVNSWPATIPAKVTGQLDHPDLIITQRDHPLCRYINAGFVSLARARRVELPERSVVLARSTDGSPLIFLIEEPNRTSLCIAFDVLESDLVFRNAFPLLLRNAVSYLVDQRARWLKDTYQVAESIEPLRPLPPTVQQVSISSPKNPKPDTAPVADGRFLFDKTHQLGPLRFTFADQSIYTAVNLTDAVESRIAPVRAEKSPRDQLALSARLFGAVPWVALAAIATLLVGLEWFTYHHRWTE